MRPGGRRGCPRHRPEGSPRGRGFGRFPPEPAHGGARDRRSTAQGIRTRTRSCRGGRDVQRRRLRLLPSDGNAAADDRLLPAGFTRRTGGLVARSRQGQLLQASARSSTGSPWAVSTRDSIVDNITLYWLMVPQLGGPVVLGGCASAGRIACERPAPPAATVPVGFTAFPGEIWASPRSWVQALTRTSRTSTRSTRAATSPPGRSRSSSRGRCGLHSAQCARRASATPVHARSGCESPCPRPGPRWARVRTCSTRLGDDDGTEESAKTNEPG